MLRRVVYSMALAGLVQNGLVAQEVQPRNSHIPAIDELFQQEERSVVPVNFNEPVYCPPPVSGVCAPPPACDKVPCDATPCGDMCVPIAGGCDSVACDDGWCSSLCDDTPLLECLKNQKIGCWTYSIGGAFRYRYIDEANRLRPGGLVSDYSQTRFTPYLEVKRGDEFTAYIQAIDAHTFGNEASLLAIDEDRADLLQFYADTRLLGDKNEQLRFKAGRQFLQYGSQHLVSPLAWGNTFRNFEGYKLYYTSPDWNIDAFATRPVNGASGNIFRPTSFDSPDQSRWFSGVYSTWKKAPKGTLDLYWLWLDEDEEFVTVPRIDGNRHTFGARYAGSHAMKDECGDAWMTYGWDWEAAYQTGQDFIGAGPAQDVRAGFVSLNSGLTFNQVPWKPTLTGVFYYGSGDDDPNDGVNHTVSTLFPLGHAYWGLIDNFSGQNLVDYSPQLVVNPTKKLSFLTAVHWFQKAQAEDAIWNIAGAPVGGLAATDSRDLGTEIDLVATYQVNKNLQLQSGYFWFFYGDAVEEAAPRPDADMFYFFADWNF